MRIVAMVAGSMASIGLWYLAWGFNNRLIKSYRMNGVLTRLSYRTNKAVDGPVWRDL